MIQAISQDTLNSVLKVLRYDSALRGRLANEVDSGSLIEEIARKAGLKSMPTTLSQTFTMTICRIRNLKIWRLRQARRNALSNAGTCLLSETENQS